MKRGLIAGGLGLACLSVFLPQWWMPALGLVVAVGAAALSDRTVLRSALRLGFVLAALFAAAVGGSAVAWSAGWQRGLGAGGGLLARLLVLWIVAGVLSRSVSTEAVFRASRRLGFERFGLALGLALNALPRLIGAGRKVWIAHRVRSGSMAATIRGLPVLSSVLLAQTIRIADDAAGAAALRGHEALVRPRTRKLACTSPVIVLSGRPGSGKTSILQVVVERLRSDGFAVAGLIQPGRFEDGVKVGFAVRNLQTGEEVPFARRTSREAGEHGTVFRFDASGLAFARQALETAPPGAILLVDELGPVELRGQGHFPALREVLNSRPPRLMILVVRRHLVPALLSVLKATEARIVDVDGGSDKIIDEVLVAVRDLVEMS